MGSKCRNANSVLDSMDVDERRSFLTSFAKTERAGLRDMLGSLPGKEAMRYEAADSELISRFFAGLRKAHLEGFAGDEGIDQLRRTAHADTAQSVGSLVHRTIDTIRCAPIRRRDG